MKVAIIGAGLGGLSAACRLAKAGYEVEVFEQLENAGGKANFIHKKGFRFDTGPSLITMPFVFEEFFNEMGEKTEDFIRFLPLSPITRNFYEDQTIVDTDSDVNIFSTELKTKLGEEKYPAFFQYTKKIYDLTADLFLFRSFGEWKLRDLPAFLHVRALSPLKSMNQKNRRFFKSSKALRLFGRYATYNGSSPYLTPATLNIIPYVEFGFGGYMAEGGIYSIPSALFKLARKLGVTFHFNSKVRSILHDGKKVTGIQTEKAGHEFDIVLSNADVSYTYQNLLDGFENKTSKRYKKLQPSSSAIVFFWGIGREFPQLLTNNIFFSEDYPKEFSQIFQEKTMPESPTIYVNITSKLNPEDAPSGKENWFVLVNAPSNSGQNWDEMVFDTRRTALKRLSRFLDADIEKLIETEEILTPQIIEDRTASRYGSLYGISSNTASSAFLRQQNREKSLSGLYFCGGSAHPGGGMPLVLLSGKLASDFIQKDFPISGDNDED